MTFCVVVITHFPVISSNGSYYSIDLTIVDPSLLIYLHWSVHDVLCGSYHSLSCHILKTECTENWKFNKADWNLFENLCLVTVLWLKYCRYGVKLYPIYHSIKLEIL